MTVLDAGATCLPYWPQALSRCGCHWRSLLFVPANRPALFDKAFSSGADAVCMDLEDAVRAEDKPAARAHVISALAQPRQAAAAVRLNAVGSPWYEGDKQQLRGLSCEFTLLLPKAHLDSLATLIQDVPGHRIIPLLEDAQGVEEAYEIAQQEPVTGLLLGGADLAAQLGASMTWDALLYARSRLLMAAANAACLAIDVPCLALKKPDLVFRETERVKALGYSCKGAIHPLQIDPIHRALAPTAFERDEARAMLDAFEQAGGNAVALNGMLLDEPMLALARRTLALAGEKA